MHQLSKGFGLVRYSLVSHMRFDDRVLAVLTAAGWYEGRKSKNVVSDARVGLETNGGFEMFPAAEATLLEFGGLRVNQSGPGITCARAPFDLNPLLAVLCEDIFDEFARFLEQRLFPLGEAFGGHMFLAIAESGEIFVLMDEILRVGDDIDSALRNLIIGHAPQPVVRA